jgi:hypothetical protein
VYEASSAARLRLVRKEANLKQPKRKKCCHLNVPVP